MGRANLAPDARQTLKPGEGMQRVLAVAAASVTVLFVALCALALLIGDGTLRVEINDDSKSRKVPYQSYREIDPSSFTQLDAMQTDMEVEYQELQADSGLNFTFEAFAVGNPLMGALNVTPYHPNIS